MFYLIILSSHIFYVTFTFFAILFAVHYLVTQYIVNSNSLDSLHNVC